MSKTPADLIFTLCFEADISASELARRIGYDRIVVYRVMSGETIASDRMMKALERYLAEREVRKK